MNSPSLEEIVREWEDQLGPENLAKAHYQERMRMVQFFLSPVVAVLLAVLWLPTGLAVHLRDALGRGAAWYQAWAVILVIMLVNDILLFPLDWFFGCHVENRLGTNRQTLGGWLADQVKEKGINLLLQSLMFLGLYLVFRHWPRQWFWGLSGVVVLVLVVLYLIQPWLIRMRFKAEPLDNPALEARLRQLFAQTGVPFSRLALLNASEKSSRANAALVPKGAGTEVVLFDTLLQDLDNEAIAAVVAHELGHKMHHDMLKVFTLLGIGLIAALAAGYETLTVWGRLWGLHGPADVATFPLLTAAVAVFSMVLTVGLNVYSRHEEEAADRFALETIGQAAPFIRAMQMLARKNKALPQPSRWVEMVLYNHPSLARRVQNAYAWQARRSATPTADR